MTQNIAPSRVIEAFLDWMAECEKEYKEAKEEVKTEDLRLVDLVHEMEFAGGRDERNRIATKLHHSRCYRRERKDRVQLLEPIQKFLADPKTRETINRMKAMKGQLKKTEEYLAGERTYTHRVEDDMRKNH